MRTLLPIATIIILIYALSAQRCVQTIAVQSKAVESQLFILRQPTEFASASSVQSPRVSTHTTYRNTPKRSLKNADTTEHTQLYMVVPSR